MIEKWVNFKRDYLEISFLRENCGYDGSDDRRRYNHSNLDTLQPKRNALTNWAI